MTATKNDGGDLRVAVHDEGDGTWKATVNGRVEGRSNTRDMALFWAGWWYGRKQLGKAVAAHVSEGGSIETDCLDAAKRRRNG